MTATRSKFKKFTAVTAAIVLLFLVMAIPVAAAATDVIHNFTITVDVNDDASLYMVYHIDWEVLDDSIGELEWIDLGVPNEHHTDITPLTDTIDYLVGELKNAGIVPVDQELGTVAEPISPHAAFVEEDGNNG